MLLLEFRQIASLLSPCSLTEHTARPIEQCHRRNKIRAKLYMMCLQQPCHNGLNHFQK